MPLTCCIRQVLITKLRSANTVETRQYRKASKALLVLIPLLGITYLVVLAGPNEGVGSNVFAVARAFLLSTQVNMYYKSISAVLCSDTGRSSGCHSIAVTQFSLWIECLLGFRSMSVWFVTITVFSWFGEIWPNDCWHLPHNNEFIGWNVNSVKGVGKKKIAHSICIRNSIFFWINNGSVRKRHRKYFFRHK